jgi:hypothetical protein
MQVPSGCQVGSWLAVSAFQRSRLGLATGKPSPARPSQAAVQRQSGVGRELGYSMAGSRHPKT